MRFYTKTHKYYCGIDLHARAMYVCIVDQQGTILLHKNMKCDREVFLAAIAPYREDIVVSVECMFAWYWLADLCLKNEIAFVLGHALYMKAIHGGKAKNDKIDAQKIALLLRGGLIPQSYVYPPGWRSTRDLLRRRIFFVRQRAYLMSHISNTASQYNLEPLPRQATRNPKEDDLAAHFEDAPVSLSVATDAKIISFFNGTIREVESFLVDQAESHAYEHYFRLRSIPGVGTILALVFLYEIHDVSRFPSVGDFISYSRLVKCVKESNGKKYGKSGAKMGNAYLKWAFGEAALLFVRENSKAKELHTKLERKHGKGKAYAIIAQRLGRAVYFILKRNEVFSIEKFFALA